MKLKSNLFLLISILGFFIIISGCSLPGNSTGRTTGSSNAVVAAAGTNNTITDPNNCTRSGSRPQVTYTINANGATNVFLNTKVGAFFTTEMDARTFNESTFSLIKEGKRNVKGSMFFNEERKERIEGVVAYNGLGATFTPRHNLEPNTIYTATIESCVRDLNGNSMTKDYVWGWTTGTSLDTTLPAVIHTQNPNGATNVFLNTKIIATFNKVMDAATVTPTTFTFKQGSISVPGKVTFTGISLIFTPAANLSPNTTYTATITTGVKDLAGNPLSSNYVWSWTTGTRLNTAVPSVLYTTPTVRPSLSAISASIISTGVLTVSATFSDSMDPLTITTLTFLLNQGATPISGVVLYNDQSMTASFIPNVTLLPSTTYTATITTGVTNAAGTPLTSNYTWNFTTSSAVTLAPVNLGTAANFALLAGSTITSAGLTIVNGDIGLNPGISVTGFPPAILNGTLHLGDSTAVAAKLDLLNAFNDAAGRVGVLQVATELGGTTLAPGVYNSAAGTFSITGSLTLDGQGNSNAVFIFQTASTLVTAAASKIVLINGAQAKNVFIQVGSSATLGINSIINGNIMAQASITVSAGVTINGRALALAAAITLDTNTITSPLFTPSSSSSSVSSASSSSSSSSSSSVSSSSSSSSSSTTTLLPVNLGTAANFAILAGSTITSAGLTVVNGDIGLNPGISVTGFPPAILNGTLHLGDSTAVTAKLDLLTAFNDAAGRTGSTLISPEAWRNNTYAGSL